MPAKCGRRCVNQLEFLRQRPRAPLRGIRGVFSSLSVITSSTCASLSRRGVPGRGSSSPSRRFAAKRRRQRPAVCRVIRSSVAISEFDRPAAHANTICAHWARPCSVGTAPRPLLQCRALAGTHGHANRRVASFRRLLLPEVRGAPRIRFRTSDPGHERFS